MTNLNFGTKSKLLEYTMDQLSPPRPPVKKPQRQIPPPPVRKPKTAPPPPVRKPERQVPPPPEKH